MDNTETLNFVYYQASFLCGINQNPANRKEMPAPQTFTLNVHVIVIPMFGSGVTSLAFNIQHNKAVNPNSGLPSASLVLQCSKLKKILEKV